jgi:hypothetical protein
MFVLFDLNTFQSYKSKDLQVLKDFVKRNSMATIEWWKFSINKKVIHSDCNRFTIENWSGNLKGIHYFQTIAAVGAEPKKQN